MVAACATLPSVTNPLAVPPAGVAFCVHRRETNPPTQTATLKVIMSANVAALTAQIEELQSNFLKSVETITAAINEIQQQQVQQVSIKEPAELAPFNEFLVVELTQFFGAKESKMIVEKLRRCRAIGDFRYFIPMYLMAKDDLKKRQLMKTVSAVYRYKFGGYRNPEKYSLRSEIKYAAACPECGEMATILVNRLKAEGLWK